MFLGEEGHRVEDSRVVILGEDSGGNEIGCISFENDPSVVIKSA
jgi:hypothetical protein